MRLLVCGGRDYADGYRLFAVLDDIHAATPISVIIHGAAIGADSLADEWAKSRGVTVESYPISRDEHRYLKGRAGHARNQRMLDASRPDRGLGFPGGNGTADMLGRLRAAGVPVEVIS